MRTLQGLIDQFRQAQQAREEELNRQYTAKLS